MLLRYRKFGGLNLRGFEFIANIWEGRAGCILATWKLSSYKWGVGIKNIVFYASMTENSFLDAMWGQRSLAAWVEKPSGG